MNDYELITIADNSPYVGRSYEKLAGHTLYHSGEACSECGEPLAECNPMRNARATKRVPNHKLGHYLDNKLPFSNYNATITGYYHADTYVVKHWATEMFVVSKSAENKIHLFELPFISQTSSALVGRILRSNMVNADNMADWLTRVEQGEVINEPRGTEQDKRKFFRKWWKWVDAQRRLV